MPEPEPIGRQAPVRERLVDTPGVLLATDFDGTLAPIEPEPDRPLATQSTRRALEHLAAHPAVVVAVISGRSLLDLRPRVGLEEAVYAGNHGLEIDRGRGPQVHPDAKRQRPRIAEACKAIAPIAEREEGICIEDKGLSATVHHRRASERATERIQQAALSEAERPGARLRVSTGKACLELRPDVAWDKGSALSSLARDAPEGWRVIYLGDDDTDEDAFDAMDEEGISVHVGTRRDTAAAYRLRQQSMVAPFLDGLARELHGHPPAREQPPKLREPLAAETVPDVGP